jgi:hypothetical protein
LDGIVGEYDCKYGLKDHLSRSYLLTLLHLEACIIVVVKVDPSNTIEVLMLPGHHIHKNSEWFDHAVASTRSYPS